MAEQKRDYYEVLGISKSADKDAIKKAHRSMAKKYHPDLNKEKDAEAKFREVQEAYEILSDDKKRQMYDQYGHAGVDPNAAGGQGGFGGFGGFDFSGAQGFNFQDIFSDFFGGGGGGSRSSSRQSSRSQGSDRLMQMSISLEESCFGVTKTIELFIDEECSHCHGSGANSPNDIRTCPTCRGSGKVIQVANTIFGQMKSEAVCPHCHGTGKQITKACQKCNGKGYTKKKVVKEIDIPAGINTGQQLKIAGLGERGSPGTKHGDLYIEIVVKPHNIFKRDGNNLETTTDISVLDAILGSEITIKGIAGDLVLSIPQGTQDGSRFRIKGRGVKYINRNENGDLYVKVNVKIPTHLDSDERELYQTIRKLKDGMPPSDDFLTKLKKMFKK